MPLGETLEKGTRLAVGFGCVELYCDGVRVWYGDGDFTVEMAELLASSYDFGNSPAWDDDYRLRDRSMEHLWEITYEAPLWSAHCVRKGVDLWVCVRRGMGFA